MAILFPHLKTIVSLISQTQGPTEIASLGFPDLLVSKSDMISLLGKDRTSILARRKDEKDIIAAHGQQARLDQIFDTNSLFESYGVHLTVFDIQRVRGTEVLLNLNDPIPDDWKTRFHLVLDPGTLEHCFNVATAIRNIAEMVRVGGRILHHNPLNHVNHGFFNFSPTFFYDFYSFNGFCIESYPLIEEGGLSPWQPFAGNLNSGWSHNLVVKRLETRTIRWPPQGHYRNMLFVKAFFDALTNHSEWDTVALAPAGSITNQILSGTGPTQKENLILLDEYKAGTIEDGLKISSPNDASLLNPSVIFVTSLSYELPLTEALHAAGFPSNRVMVFRNGRFAPLDATMRVQLNP